MFGEYLRLGVEHILDLNGIDHVLFLIVLALPYTIWRWKSVLILATAFTLGHSVTLALSALDIIRVDSDLIEIGIAVSIFLTALLNLLSPSAADKENNTLRYIGAVLFGLIHGMGFSNFFKTILGNEDITIPLLAFNLGVEIAQVAVVVIVLLVSWSALKLLDRKWWNGSISVIVLLWSLKMILERI